VGENKPLRGLPMYQSPSDRAEDGQDLPNRCAVGVVFGARAAAPPANRYCILYSLRGRKPGSPTARQKGPAVSTSQVAPLVTSRVRSHADQCIHCGLCLEACPTYRVFRTEMEGPRGRIDLIRAASDGRIGLDGAFRHHVDLCLGCRSCESACPSGVRYGELADAAAAALHAAHPPGAIERTLRWLVLRQAIPYPARLRALARLIAIYQRAGLARAVRLLLPDSLRRLEALLPPVPFTRPRRGHVAPALGAWRGTVAFFHGCLQDALLETVNAATIRVLQQNGFEVRSRRGRPAAPRSPPISASTR
jgi:ferredoxin